MYFLEEMKLMNIYKSTHYLDLPTPSCEKENFDTGIATCDNEFDDENTLKLISRLSEDVRILLTSKKRTSRRLSEPFGGSKALSQGKDCNYLRRYSSTHISMKQQKGEDEASLPYIDTFFKLCDPFLLLNIERINSGVPELSKSSILENSAKIHAMNMAKYDGLYYFATELLAKDNCVKEIVAYAKSIHCIHELMMNLAYERSNMLSIAYSTVGISVAKGARDVYFACYLFA